jgi:YidC/Oxa1 family membrane protein insertase
MEKRLLIAIVLSFLVLLLFQLVFVKKAPDIRPEVAPTAQAQNTVANAAPQEKPADKTVQGRSSSAKKPSNLLKIKQLEESGAIDITVSTSLYEAVWSNRGGVLTSWKLRNHKNDKKEDLDLVPAAAKETGAYPFAILDDDPDVMKSGPKATAENAYNLPFFQVNAGAIKSSQKILVKDTEKSELRFAYADEKGTEVEKVFTFYGGSYQVDISVRLRKNGEDVTPRVLWGPGIGNPSEAEIKQRAGAAASGGSFFVSGKIVRIAEDIKKYKPETSGFNYVSWAAFDDNYFAALFLPSGQNGTASLIKLDSEKGSYFFLSVTNPSKAFIGAKEYDALSAFGHDAKKIVQFGFFGIFAEALFYSIKFIHKFVPNWGWAIIILTVIIKILFFPLTYSSTKSMAKMADLQPKIKALRNKYKKSKTDIEQRRQMNEEMMKLYKAHGVNPAGGCLPMLIQIPFFFGFFSMLRAAIEFRRSPWIFWIKDLSVHDPIYITPILMGITQFVSQKMTPTSADPSQQRMMLLMPLIFTVFFMGFSSGLVIYWLTSNVVQIGQQYLMNRMMKAKKSEIDGKRRKN